MSLEMRKSFIGQILVGLIDKTTDINFSELHSEYKTTDSKVMKAITKMVEDWVKTKVNHIIFLGLVGLIVKSCRSLLSWWKTVKK